MAAPLVPLGQQLYNDIAHDFTRKVAQDLNYSTGNDGDHQGEGDTVTSLLAAMAATGDATFNARNTNQVIFTMPEGTSAFKPGEAPVLHPTGNENVGIIHDAGEFLTLDLGAHNVVTFGSILDPAPKPVAPERKPIWYDSGPGNNVTIDLAPFGFDAKVIKSLVIQDLRAGDVKAGFVIGGETKDAIAMSDTDPGNPVPIKPKPINKTDISLAGFFTSIAKAENLKRELRETLGYTLDDANELVTTYGNYFYIGKTLGDVSLVASGLDAVSGAYTGVGMGLPPPGAIAGTPGWKWWAAALGDPGTPRVLMLKTGDQLNWIRAIAYGMGAIYEDQAKGGRKIKQYKFFPGTVDDETLRAAFVSGFDKLRKYVTDRYNAVIGVFEGMIETNPRDATQTRIKKGAMVFSSDGHDSLTSQNGRRVGVALIVDVVAKLRSLQATVDEWVGTRKGIAATIEPLNDLKDYYEWTRNTANLCSPAAETPYVTKKSGSPYLFHLAVAIVPAGVTAPDWPVTTPLTISLQNAIVKINNAGSTATLASTLAGTDIQNRFLSRWPPAPLRGGTKAAGEGVADDSTKAYVESMLDVVFRATNGVEEISPVTGFVAKYPDEFTIDKQWYPRISDFAEFCGATGNLVSVLPLVAEVVDNKESRFVMDEVLATALEFELRDMLERGDVAPTTEAVTTPGSGCVWFNAYTFHVNARNASILVGDVSYDTETTTDYDAFRDAFLSVANNAADAWGAEAAARAQAQYNKAEEDALTSDNWPPVLPPVSPPGSEAVIFYPVVKPIGGPREEPRSGPMKRPTGAKARQMQASKSMYGEDPYRPRYNAASSSSAPVDYAREVMSGFNGGLRERRPLYRNASGTSDGPERDEGLRERRRTRRAPRVRQHPGKSRRGGQRNDVD